MNQIEGLLENAAEGAFMQLAKQVILWPLTALHEAQKGKIIPLAVGLGGAYWYLGGVPSLTENAALFARHWVTYGAIVVAAKHLIGPSGASAPVVPPPK